SKVFNVKAVKSLIFKLFVPNFGFFFLAVLSLFCICLHYFFSYTIFLLLHSLMSLIHTAKLLRVKPVYVLRQLIRACGVFPEMATNRYFRLYSGSVESQFFIGLVPFRCCSGYVKLPPEKFAPKKQGDGGKDLPTEAKKLQLNSAEELYAEIRDKNFNAVGSVLSKKAKVISAAFEERHNAKTVGEIKQFVSQLPHMQAARGSLANHTSIAELIKDVTTSEDFFDKLTVEQEFMSGIDTDKVNSYIEDCIAQKHPLIKVLRLVCLQSVCNNGLKQKVLDYYKREILQTYGYEHILTLHNLEKAGLLKPQTGGRNNYPTIRKTLRLWMDDVNEQNPTDISYVYSGYAPLSVRLAQLLSRPGWRSIEEVLRILPGPHFEERQPLPTGLQKKRQPGENRVTLIFFLGGVTFAEIAALRFLSQLEDGGTEYVIATTKLINGASWIESLMEKPF
ncbi:hypothetical protein FD754_023277, partial [Muntiacus muntjak]